MKSPLFSVIVPSYKQDKTIYKDLSAISNVLDKISYQSELICVVDGYVDKTFENATKLAKKNKKIKVIGYKDNQGKGYAVRYGMAASRGDIVAFIDSGMDINPTGLSTILRDFIFYNADIVVGSKKHSLSKVNSTFQRKLVSLAYQLFVKLLFGLKIKDTQVGLKCYKREVLKSILPRLIVNSFAFDIEILAVSNHLGFSKIYESPVKITFDNNSKVLTFKRFYKYILSTFKDTLIIFYRLRVIGYYSTSNNAKWKSDSALIFK